MNTLLLIGTAAAHLLAGAFAVVAVFTAATSVHKWNDAALLAAFWLALGSTGLVFIARALP